MACLQLLETSHRWHPPQRCCSFFFMGCIFFVCVEEEDEEEGGQRGGGILATAPEAIVYYSSGRLVCRGRGFKRRSRGRKNFFLSRSVRTRRRLSFSSLLSALRLCLFFFFSRLPCRQNPLSRRHSHFQHADRRQHSLAAFSLPLLPRDGEVLIQ